MSLPKRLYDLFRELLDTDLVKTRTATPENMLVFQNILNQATPSSEVEVAQHELVRGIYFSNPGSFSEYLSDRRNRASALVLWTESKRIAKFFNLGGVVHISWVDNVKSYHVVPYVPRDQREPRVEVEVTAVTDNESPMIPLQAANQTGNPNRRARRAAANAEKPKGIKSTRGLAARKFTNSNNNQQRRQPRNTNQTPTYADVVVRNTTDKVDQLDKSDISVPAGTSWSDMVN